MVQLKQELGSRGLPKKGAKAELVAALRAWEEAQQALQQAEQQQAQQEAGTAGEDAGVSQQAQQEEYQAPYPPPLDPAGLERAQRAFAAMQEATMPVLRDLLRDRQLSCTGTREVLVGRLGEALEREAVHAFGGRRQLSLYSKEAVGQLSEAEVYEELSARSMDTQLPQQEAVASLEEVVVREWLEDALYAGLELYSAGAPAPADVAAQTDSWDGWEEGAEGEGLGSQQDLPPELAAAPQLPPDPPLTLALLCCGSTPEQRQAAVQAARMAVHLLQTDPCHGTLPAVQLYEGQDQPVTGVAVSVYYATQSGTLCALSWERLHGASAIELDASLELAGDELAVDAQALLEAADLAMPLGAPAGALEALLEGAGAKVVGAGALSAATGLAHDSVALQARLRQLGYPALSLLRLGMADFQGLPVEGEINLGGCRAYQAVTQWLEGLGEEPDIARVAVRAEVAGDVAEGTLVMGAEDVLQAALALMASEQVDSVVLEAVHPEGAVYFSCTVLGTPQGAVALPPSDLDSYDIEKDLFDTQLSFERFLAIHEGEDPEAVDQLLDHLRRGGQIHPGYVGGPATASQELRRSTPPAGLTPEAAQQLRQAATKLFQDLGLRDYAQFSGWVIPSSTSAERPAALAQREEPSAELAAEERPRGLSFAELASTPPATTFGPGGAARAQQEGGGAVVERGAGGQRYGVFNGLVIDDSTRVDWIREHVKPDPRVKPIPERGESVVVEALEDLSPLPPLPLCTLPGDQGVVHFTALSIDPPLSSPSSLLFQQGAAAGISHRAVLRQLLAPALGRAGLEALPALPPAEPDMSVFEEAADAPRNTDADPLADYRIDLEEVGRVVEAEADQLSMARPLTPEQVAELQRMEDEDEGFDARGLNPWQDPIALQAELAAVEREQEGGEVESFFEVDKEDWDRRVLGAGASAADSASPSGEPAAAAAEAYDPDGAPLGLGAFGEGEGSYGEGAQRGPGQGRGAAAPGGGGSAGRQRVWIVCGGDGPLRDESLEGGLHAYLHLSNQPYLDVDVFMAEPSDCGGVEMDRRRKLLEKRLDLLKLGADDDYFADSLPELLEPNIRTPPPSTLSIDAVGMWRLTGSGVLRETIPEMQLACETYLADATTAPANQDAEQAAARAAHSVTQQQLTLAGVNLDGSVWGGVSAGALTLPGAPGYQFLDAWAAEARDSGAVVLLALSGNPLALGPLQRVLEAKGVPVCGCGVTVTELCADKLALMQQLLDLEREGISTAPQYKISLPELEAQCADVAAADTLFGQLSTYLGAPGSTLCIKPASTTFGRGVTRIGCGRDLAVYAAAVSGGHPEIPSQLLSQQEDDVAMPLPAPTLFVVEPFVATESLQIMRGPDGTLSLPASTPPLPHQHPDPTRAALEQRLHWGSAENQWVEVVAHIVGEGQKVVCLGPSVLVSEVQQGQSTPSGQPSAQEMLVHLSSQIAERRRQEAAELEGEGDEEGEAGAELADAELAGSGEVVRAFELTPPPTTWVAPEAVAAFKLRMQILSSQLGLQGVARVDAFMHSVTGECVVTEVDPLPLLGPDALIFSQAACEEQPWGATDVFLELVRVGMSRGGRPEEGDDMAGALGYGSDFSDGGNDADDMLLSGRDFDAPPGWQQGTAEGDDWRLDYDPDFSQTQQGSAR